MPTAQAEKVSGGGRRRMMFALLWTGCRSTGFRAPRARGGCPRLQSRQLIVDGGAIFIEEARDRFQFAGVEPREDSGGGASDAPEDRPHFPGGAFAGNYQDAAPIVTVALPGDVSGAFEPVEKRSDGAGG